MRVKSLVFYHNIDFMLSFNQKKIRHAMIANYRMRRCLLADLESEKFLANARAY